MDDKTHDIWQGNIIGVVETVTDLTELKRARKKAEQALLDLLEACEWNKAEVGRRVGLSRTAIWKYMKNRDVS